MELDKIKLFFQDMCLVEADYTLEIKDIVAQYNNESSFLSPLLEHDEAQELISILEQTIPDDV